MIATLDDARRWYEAVSRLARVMDRIGRKYWDAPELAEILGRDNHFRDLTSGEIRELSKTILADLDDLAVLVLFSVFEAVVRERALDDVERELTDFRHPALLRAVEQLRETLAHGSFARVTESYKSLDPELTEEVNQVRKFRNWVAHGRRGDPENNVAPPSALDRLRRFLDRMDDATKSPPLAQDFTSERSETISEP